jgi:hypothetical protein
MVRQHLGHLIDEDRPFLDTEEPSAKRQKVDEQSASSPVDEKPK